MIAGAWIVRLSATAEADYVAILRWTVEHFGPDQAASYAAVLSEALKDLAAGPETLGVKFRRELGKDLYTLHVSRGKRRGRHFVLFRVGMHESHPSIDVFRLLHESMDLVRHLPPPDSQE